MKEIKNQDDIYKKVANRIQHEIESTLKLINEEMEKEITPEIIKKLANLFIIISNLNHAQTLLKTIKTTK